MKVETPFPTKRAVFFVAHFHIPVPLAYKCVQTMFGVGGLCVIVKVGRLSF
jgi:hypothetical protein